MSQAEDKKIDPQLRKLFSELAQERHTIYEYIEDFISEFSALSTRRAYKNDLKMFIMFLKSGEVKITHPRDIKDFHFKTYRDHLQKEQKSSATINRKLVAIRAFLKWALTQKHIEINPVEGIKLPKIQIENPTQAYEDQEVMAMINAPNQDTFKGNLQRISFALLFHIGLRRSELTNLKLRDIRENRRNYFLSIKGKGSKTREVPLTVWLQLEIQKYLQRLKEYKVELSSEDFLLQTSPQEKNTRPINGSTIYRWIKSYSLKLGINRKLSPHSCRATAISHLLDTRQVPIRDVAIFAGHENVNTTERYDKRRENLDKNAAYEVDYEDRHKKSSK